MKAAVLACGNLVTYVMAALKKYDLDMPVICLNLNLHVEPTKMREAIIDALRRRIPKACDTVLVAQGYCGGSWENITPSRRVVLPRVDDCVTMALTTDDRYQPNRKKMRHMYDFNIKTGFFSPYHLYQSLVRQYGKAKADDLFALWFADYHDLDVVSTGLENLTDPAYIAKTAKGAMLMGAEVHVVPGSNRMIEKLVTGRWDEQFVIKQPYETITMADFVDSDWQIEQKAEQA